MSYDSNNNHNSYNDNHNNRDSHSKNKIVGI